MSGEHASHCGEPERRSYAHLARKAEPKEFGTRAERRAFARLKARQAKRDRKDG